ncbi:hypothetical protein EJB05_40670, partial [Eragrostis curvula]
MARADRVVARAFLWLFVAVAASMFLFPRTATALWDPTWRPGLAIHPLGTAMAVDLGNTNSCVAGYVRGKSETMFQACIPSWVALSDDGTLLVGEEAKNYAAVNPEAAITGFKRLFGKRLAMWYEGGFVQRIMEKFPYKAVDIPAKGITPHIELKTSDGVVRHLRIEDMVSTVFAKLRETPEAYVGRKIQHAVFTLPQQYRTDLSRDSVPYAATFASLSPMRILDEPIAAAVAYGLHTKLRELEPYFGGQDFDRRIVDHFIHVIREKHGKDISNDDAALRKLMTASEDAKKTLSSQDHAQLNIKSLVDGVDLSETLTRAKFEELNHDLFLKVVELIDTVMAQAELEKRMVDEVVLIGGSTMIPKIRKIVEDYFDGKELNTKLKPDEAVTFGAALLSHPTANGYPCMGENNWYQIGGPSDACYV